MFNILLILFINVCLLCVLDGSLTVTWKRVDTNYPQSQPLPQQPPPPHPLLPPQSFTESTRTTTTRISTLYNSQTIMTANINSSSIQSTVISYFMLPNSNCICLFSFTNNILCTKMTDYVQISNVKDHSIDYVANFTVMNCSFVDNRLYIPSTFGYIEYLQITNVNNGNYLIIDSISLQSSIKTIDISYTISKTILLINNNTFLLFGNSLYSLKILHCILILLPNTLNKLINLVTLSIDIENFNLKEFHLQTYSLSQLQLLNITADDHVIYLNNVSFCEFLRNYRSILFNIRPTCTCELVTMMKSVDINNRTFYQCLNQTYYFNHNHKFCYYNGIKYNISNENMDNFCSICKIAKCPFGTICSISPESISAICLPTIYHNFDYIYSIISYNELTKPFFKQEIGTYLSSNKTMNKTLETPQFNSIANVLILNSNLSLASDTETYVYHNIFTHLLDQDWNNNITTMAQRGVWQQLLNSIENSMKTIDNNIPLYRYESDVLSSSSLFISQQNQQQFSSSKSVIFGWQINSNNTIRENISKESFTPDDSTSTTVFLNLSTMQQPSCNLQNQGCVFSPNSMNFQRYGITSLKSSKLFAATDRIPDYNVISVIAPIQQQTPALVTIYFRQKMSNLTSTTSFYDKAICMYLDIDEMIWKQDGCETKTETQTIIQCKCNHLTMFTVFFSPDCTSAPKFLNIISYIGICLSLIGLTVCVIMFLISQRCHVENKKNVSKSLPSIASNSHSSDETVLSSNRATCTMMMRAPRLKLSIVKSMLFVLCILLIIMNILILILTFIKPGQNVACIVFSAGLYYVTLVSFIWKFLFALQQCIFITSLLQNWSDKYLLVVFGSITLLLPIIPLIIMFLVVKNITFVSTTCQFCWLSREFVIFALMVPILSITTVNFILYSYTMIRLAIKNRLQVGLRSTISEHQRRTQNLKIGLFFAIIMGLTWSFGFLLLISNTVVQLIGNILFCITNTIQGFCFFLMVFWMIEQNKTRDQLRICCNYCIGNMKQRQPQVRMKVLKTSSSNTTCSTDEQTQKEPKAFGSVQNRRIIETQLDDHTYTSLF